MVRHVRPLLTVFIVVNILLILLRILLVPDILYPVLWTGNAILFVASLISFYLFKKALLDKNPHAFIRLVYGGILLKMVICVAAAMLYILLTDGRVSKSAILECFCLYFLYTFIEIKKIMQLSKQQKNA
jgi:hypothetical protein